MKKSINVIIFLSLFISISTTGQNDQSNYLLAVEYNNVPSNPLKGLVNTEVITYRQEVESIVTKEIKQYNNIGFNTIQDFTSLLDKKPSLERVISLKGAPKSGPRPIHAIDFQYQEVNILKHKNITQPLRVNRASNAFGPAYQF